MLSLFKKPEPLPPSKHIQSCVAYLHRDKPHFVVATRYGRGIMFELDEGVAVCQSESHIALGQLVKARMDASEGRDWTEELRLRKPTDWPAFRQSVCKSVRAFEREYIAVTVESVNAANITYRLETEPVQWGISLTLLCNPVDAAVLGGEFHKLRKHYLKWEKT
jgi:hypothetical protein